jgi:hypothetical protein
MPTANTVTIDLAGQAQTQGLGYSGPNGLSEFLGVILNAIIIIGSVAVFFFFIMGGIQWITAGGEKSKVESARNMMMQAVIGFVVLASSIAIFKLIQSIFGLTVFTFNK